LKKLVDLKSICIDTNIFIYFLDPQSPFNSAASALLGAFADQNIALSTSTVTITELLSTKASDKELASLQESFLSIPNLRIFDISQEIALLAARFRRESNIRIIDSLQLATAIVAKAEAFLTNDQKLKNFKEVKIVALADLKL